MRTYITHRSRMYCLETANNNRCMPTSTESQINMHSGAKQTKSEWQGVKLRKVGRWIDKESKSTQSHGMTRSRVPGRKGNIKQNTHCFEAGRSWRNLSWMRKMEEWKYNSAERWSAWNDWSTTKRYHMNIRHINTWQQEGQASWFDPGA